MSQKTNPYSLRLQKTNKCFSSSWYSDYFYKEINSNDLETRSYIKSIFHQLGHSYEYLCLQSYYKRIVLFLFTVDAREILLRRANLTLRSRNSEQKEPSLKPGGPFLPPLDESKVAVASPKITAFGRSEGASSFLQPLGSAKPTYQRYNQYTKWEEKYGSELVCKNSSPLRLRGLASPNHPPQGRMPPFLFAAKSSVSKKCQQKSKPFITCLSFKFGLSLKDNFPAASRERSSQTNFAKPFKKKSTNPFVLDKVSVAQGTTVASASQRSFSHKQVQLTISPESNFRNTMFLQETHPCKNPLFGYHYLFFHFNSRFSPLVSLFSIQALHDFSTVSFLIDEIIYLLHKRFLFRQITDYILQEAIKLHFIKGVRLSCSGRFGGRSKKAQKSKTQSIQWGESSLHVFSSKLSFASRSALTPFGKVGVKLWLSYR